MDLWQVSISTIYDKTFWLFHEIEKFVSFLGIYGVVLFPSMFESKSDTTIGPNFNLVDNNRNLQKFKILILILCLLLIRLYFCLLGEL